MSLIVTISVSEGIVMASDSRITVQTTSSIPLSDSAYKTFLCPNGAGISSCGNASYNNHLIGVYIEDFIQTYIKKDFPINKVPAFLLDYFNKLDAKASTIFHVGGYENIENVKIPKIYRVTTGPSSGITLSHEIGCFIDGETSVMQKILLPQAVLQGNSCTLPVKYVTVDLPGKSSQTIDNPMLIDKQTNPILEAAPIAWEYMSLQDAIDFAVFSINTTINAMKFLTVPKTVGGPIDILIIKPNGSRWLKHKKLEIK